MDIGIQMGWDALEDKLEERDNPRRRELTWNLTRLPRFEEGGENRLFVAAGGAWRGYFILKDEVLFSPEDSRCPYALLFDPRSWVEIKPVKVKRFRGFTYQTPSPGEVVPSGGGDVSPPGGTGQKQTGKVGQIQAGDGSIPNRE
jgi:hypothetical protein